MIPEFNTGKSTASRNSPEQPVVPDSNSGEQLLGKDAFQKALKLNDQRAEQSAERRVPLASEKPAEHGTDDVRPDQSGLSTRGTASQTDSVRSDASTDLPPEQRQTSNKIRRIDPADHPGNDSRTSSIDQQVIAESATTASNGSTASSFPVDDSHIGTLPSLVRLPLDGVSVRQFSNDFGPLKPIADRSGEPSKQATDSVSLEPSAIDEELRPTLNDTVVSDAGASGTDPRFTATDAALIVGEFQNRPAAEAAILIASEDLQAIPTLPSLRPDGVSLRLDASETSPIFDGEAAPELQVGGNSDTERFFNVGQTVSGQATAGSASVAEGLASLHGVDDAVLQLPQDEVTSVRVSDTENPSLVLPSLTSLRKKEIDYTTTAKDQDADAQFVEAGRNLTESQPGVAASNGDKTTVHVPALLKVEDEPGPVQSIAEQPARHSEPIATESDISLQTPAQPLRDQIDVSAVESGVNYDEPTNYLARRVEDGQSEPSDVSHILVSPEVTSTADGDNDVRTAAQRSDNVTRSASEQQPGLPIVANVGTVPVAAAPVPHDTLSPPGDSASVKDESGDAGFESTVKTSRQASELDNGLPRRSGEVLEARPNPIIVESVPTESAGDASLDQLTSDSERVLRVSSDNENGFPVKDQQSRQSQGVRSEPGLNRPLPERNPAGLELAGTLQTSEADSPSATSNQSSIQGQGVQSRGAESKNDQQANVIPAGDASPASSTRNGAFVSPTSATPVSADETVADSPTVPSVSGREVRADGNPTTQIDVQPVEATAASNVQSPSATLNVGASASARSDVVREPVVPMEVQDAVSAIQEATSGDSHIRVRLNPRELGNMLVDVFRTDGGVVARLEVESAAARAAVLETLPELQHALNRSGAAVDRVEVVLTESRADSGRQESDQSQPRDQQSRQDRQSSDQRQARDEQNQRREQNQRQHRQTNSDPAENESMASEPTEQIDIKL